MEFYSKLLGINYDLETVKSPPLNYIQDGPNITLDDHSFDRLHIPAEQSTLMEFCFGRCGGSIYNHIKEIGSELVTGIITWENDFKWFTMEMDL